MPAIRKERRYCRAHQRSIFFGQEVVDLVIEEIASLLAM